MICPKCGASNRAGAAVCRMCAIPLSGIVEELSSRAGRADEAQPKSKQEATNSVEQEGITCPECKTFNEAGWSFCQQCGKRLPQPESPAPANDWKAADGFRTVASDQLFKKVETFRKAVADPEGRGAPNSCGWQADVLRFIAEWRDRLAAGSAGPSPSTSRYLLRLAEAA